MFEIHTPGGHMRQLRRSAAAFAAVAALSLLACDGPTVSGPDPAAGSIRLSSRHGDGGVVLSAKGKRRYFLQNAFDVDFEFTARQLPNGKVTGRFRERLILDGETVDFSGEVTCLAFDLVNKRAWIGAVITRNRSTHPSFQEWYHQPGEDVWFRVVDYGKRDPATPDRKTFLGFENTPGIPTSEVYCQLQIWPDGDARTWPVTKGDIKVRSSDHDEGDDEDDD
jgi:hypothetical protein